MKKTFTLSILFFACFFYSPLFAADQEKTKITDLTHWKGYNVSNIKLYECKDGERFFNELTKHAPKGYTRKMVKDFIYDMFSLKFKSLNVVDENTIIIDDKISGEYVHAGSLTTKWNKHDVTWEIFKTDSKAMIKAGYKYFLFLPFHQHGKDSLRHAHLRYGNQSFDFLATDPSLHWWWPTVYQPENTDEAKIMAQMIKTAKLQASKLPPLKN